MIGTRIESRPTPPWAALLAGLAGLGLLVAAAATGVAHWAIGAILPLALAAAFFWAREPAFAARFGESALEVEHPAAAIPYEAMEGLWARGFPRDPAASGPRSYAIQVAHPGGLLRIPARLDVPSDEVFRFLASRFPREGSRDVHPLLLDYLARQEATFGPEQVWSYRAASRRKVRPAYRTLRAASVAAMAAGAGWIAAGGVAQSWESPWVPLGIVLAGVAAAFLMASFATGLPGHRGIKDWRQSSLVVSPMGLAMVQGDIRGEVRWPELRGVRLNGKPSSFRVGAGPMPTGIELKVEGATIVIADLYDRPLHVILDRIAACRG